MSSTPAIEPRIAAGELILASTRSLLDRDALPRVRNALAQPALDHALLLDMAEEHGVLPLLHKALESAGAEVPDSLKQALRDRARHCAAHNMRLVQHLIRLLSGMYSQNVRAIPYKGPTLAMFAYGDLSLRQPGDLDILVPRDDLDRARAVIESLGMKLAVPMDSKTEAAHLASPHEYDYCYVSPDGTIAVELHWQVMGKLFSFDPDPVDLWNRAIPRKLGGVTIRTLCAEDNLLVLCAHGMKHFWSRLSWIYDLAAHIRSSPELDWKLLLQRADELDARGMTLLGLVLAHRVVGAAVPEAVLNRASGSIRSQSLELEKRLFLPTDDADGLNRGLRAQLVDGGLFQSLLFHLRTRESWTSGLRYCFHRAFTPNVVDQGWLHLPKPLRFLYYPLRPLRLLGKYGPVRLITGHRTDPPMPQKP